MNNSAGTMLEQMLTARGGCGCIFGGLSNSVPWAVRVTDFLLTKISNGHRYDNIICLALDRSSQDIRDMTAGANDSEGRSVTIVQRSAIVEGGAAVRRDMPTVLSETLGAVRTAAASSNTALVVYSLSEVIEMAGEQCALNWLEAVSAVAGSAAADASDRGSSTKRPLILCVVHSSLHSRATLSRIESLCQAVSFVTPSADGLLSTSGDKVVIEVRTVRRAHFGGVSSSASRNSSRTDYGRPTEGVDLFALTAKLPGGKPSTSAVRTTNSGGKRDRVLVPCAAMRSKAGEEGLKKTSGVRQIPSRAAADKATAPAGVDISIESGSSNKDINSTVKDLAKLAIDDGASVNYKAAPLKQSDSGGRGVEPKRLIVTYDNNDPEFDEDSDPDGDLEF